jgi:hypothetical protein
MYWGQKNDIYVSRTILRNLYVSLLIAILSYASSVTDVAAAQCHDSIDVNIIVEDQLTASTDSSFPVSIFVLPCSQEIADGISKIALGFSYDPQLLVLDSFDYSHFYDSCGWFVGFQILPQDSFPSQPMLIHFVLERTNAEPCLDTTGREIRVWFHNVESRSALTTSLDCFWRVCEGDFNDRDNVIWFNGNDTALVGRQVEDADGNEIANVNGTLPGYTGPNADCLDPVRYNAHAVYRRVLFRSGSIEYRIPLEIDLSESSALPFAHDLRQNYPNPFNPTTAIEFTLSHRTSWTLTIIDLLGREIRSFTGESSAGDVIVHWDGRNIRGQEVSSGVYFYRLSTSENTESRKMLLVK